MLPSETTTDRCPLHDETYAKGAKCSRCEAVSRANAIAVTEALSPVALDAEIAKDIEADLSLAKFLHRVSRERIDDGNPNDWNAAAKLIAEGTKLKYRALDQKDKLAARAHSRWLVEHEKQVRGLAKRKGN